SKVEPSRSRCRRHQHLIQVGNRSVVQERRGGPDPVVRTRSVAEIRFDHPVLAFPLDDSLLITNVQWAGHGTKAVPLHPSILTRLIVLELVGCETTLSEQQLERLASVLIRPDQRGDAEQ